MTEDQQEAAEWRRDILGILWTLMREGHNAAEEQLDAVAQRIVNSRLASVRATWRAAARLADCYLVNEQGDLVDVVAELHKRADDVGSVERVDRLFIEKLRATEGNNHPWIAKYDQGKRERNAE